jgi:hypothetical protein
MPTVLDELVVEVGLDGQKFTEGRRRVEEEMGRTRQSAERFAESIERQGAKISDVFSTIRKGAAGVLAAFVGNEAATFIEHVGNMDAATFRLARSVRESTHELSAWQNMVRAAGGSAEEASSTFAGINDALMNFVFAAQPFSPGFSALVARAGINPVNDKPSEVLTKTAEWLAQTNATPQQQMFWLNKIPGMSGGVMALIQDLLRDPEKIKNLRVEIEKLGLASDESGEKAIELQRKTGELHTALDNLSRAGMPILTKIINAMVAVLERIPAHILAGIIGGAGTGAFLGLPIPGVGPIGGAIVGGVVGGLGAAATGGAGGGGGGGATRGDRNNNPGNIEYGAWAKAHGAIGTDGRFAIFPTKEAGEAAMAQLLRERYQGMTLEQIQRTWVFGNNAAGNTDAGYLGSMSAATGLKPGDVPNLNDPATVQKLMRGMMRGEGTHPGGEGDKTSSVNIGTLNVSSNASDPKKVADEVIEAQRRYAMLAGISTGLA